MILQDVHPLLLHGVLPDGVGGAVVFNSTQTSRSFKFLGRQKAIKGGSGMACCSLSKRSRIGSYIALDRALLQHLVHLKPAGVVQLPRVNHTNVVILLWEVDMKLHQISPVL